MVGAPPRATSCSREDRAAPALPFPDMGVTPDDDDFFTPPSASRPPLDITLANPPQPVPFAYPIDTTDAPDAPGPSQPIYSAETTVAPAAADSPDAVDAGDACTSECEHDESCPVHGTLGRGGAADDGEAEDDELGSEDEGDDDDDADQLSQSQLPSVAPLVLPDAPPPPNNTASHFSRKVHIPPSAAAAYRYGPVESVGIDTHTRSASGEGLFEDGSPLPVPRREPPKSAGLKKKLTKVVRAARIPPSAGGRNRKKVRNGQLVFKGHRSWEIVLSIQFGLRYTSELLQSSDSSEPNNDDFCESLAFDFNPVDDVRGSTAEVNHFAKWVHPAPFVYRQIRHKFRVPEEEFLEATCSESRIRELPTPGKSGALFYITNDEKYFMKTITGVEERMLMSMLRTYYTHISEYPKTLLTRYLAHFSVKTTRNNHIRMVVMASIFDDQLFIDQKYDLKGSTFHRLATPKQRESQNVTLKDLDLESPIFFSSAAVERLMMQLEKDAAFLESHYVMDYSLLLGLSDMQEDEDEYYKQTFGNQEENAPYEVGYHVDEAGQKRGVRVCMGIIDFLQRFRTRKKAEYSMRIVQSCSCKAASVAPPALYRRRFIDFLRTKLLPDPDFDIHALIQGKSVGGDSPPPPPAANRNSDAENSPPAFL